jgi:hypothetical protein
MAVLSAERIARLEAYIAADEARITAIDTALDAIIVSKAEEFWLDTGEAKQRVTQLDIAKLEALRDRAIARVEANYRRLNGKIPLNMNLSRKSIATNG